VVVLQAHDSGQLIRENMMQIDGAVVVITGASGGMGEASARYLAERGAKIVLGARNEDKLRDLVE